MAFRSAGLVLFSILAALLLAEAGSAVLVRVGPSWPESPFHKGSRHEQPLPSSTVTVPEPQWVNAAPAQLPAVPGPGALVWKTIPADYYDNRRRYSMPTPGRSYLVDVRTRQKTEPPIFHVHYTIDPFGRRVVPGQERKKRDDYFLFLGCSFVYGEGLDDDQTLPYYFSRLEPGFHVYNYSFHGYGPSDLLLRMRDTDLRAEVPEARGTVVYLFYDFHLERVLGSMKLISAWGADKALVEEDTGGALTWKGSFETAWPLRTFFYRQLAKTNFAQYFKIDLPLSYSDTQLKTFAHIVAGIRDEMRAKLGNDRFYVAFAPGSQSTPFLAPLLDAEGIPSLDFSHWHMARLTRGPAVIPRNGHPSAEYDSVLAAGLAGRPELTAAVRIATATAR
jgi:hypothetical protein